LLHDGRIYPGTDDLGKWDLKLALECPEYICAPDVDKQGTLSEFNLCHESFFSFDDDPEAPSQATYL
jgi:hypothetical protein